MPTPPPLGTAGPAGLMAQLVLSGQPITFTSCLGWLSTIVEFSASTSSKKKRRGPTAGTNLVNKVHRLVNISFLGLGSNICHPFPPADLKCLLCARPGLFWIFSWTLCFFSSSAASCTPPAGVLARSEPQRGGPRSLLGH